VLDKNEQLVVYLKVILTVILESRRKVQMKVFNSTNIISVTDLRANIGQILDELEKREQPLYIVSRSKPRAILLGVKVWKEKKEKAIADPFIQLRKRYGNLLSGVNVVSKIRKMREKRWNLS